MTKYYPNSFELFDAELIKEVKKYINYYNSKICNNSKKDTLNLEHLQQIIISATKDPCWKLMSQRVDQDSLLLFLKSNYEIN